MRQAFAKGPIDKDRSKRLADSRRREAAMADLRRALNYINEVGLKQTQNEDGSYEPGEEGIPTLRRLRFQEICGEDGIWNAEGLTRMYRRCQGDHRRRGNRR